jgi:hypothetical protein
MYEPRNVSCHRGLTGEEKEGAYKRLQMWQIMNENHLLEGRKKEECMSEFRNIAHYRGLTNWRGGKGRSA